MPANIPSRLLLKRNLNEWLHFTTVKQVPLSLLVYSQAMTTHRRSLPGSRESQLQESINKLPEEWVNEMELLIGNKLGKSNPDLGLEIFEYKVKKINEELKTSATMDVPWKKITEDRLLDIVQLLSTDHKQLTIEELNSLNEDISKYKKGGKLEQAFSTELSRLKAEIKEKITSFSYYSNSCF